MDHQQAAESMTVEKYLLDELTPELRNKFEEHFFDCEECAIDLRATAAFIDGAKRELQTKPARRPELLVSGRRRLVFFRPALAWLALAASLLVIAYQYAVVYPRYQTQMAALRAPEILPALSLVGGNSRGGQIPVVTVGSAHAFLLSFDIPTQDSYSSYTCLLYSPTGALLWRVDISGASAKDTVSLRVPSLSVPSGQYKLTVQGNGATGSPAVLANLPFTLNVLP